MTKPIGAWPKTKELYDKLKDASGVTIVRMLDDALPLLAQKYGFVPSDGKFIPLSEANKINSKNQTQNQINP